MKNKPPIITIKESRTTPGGRVPQIVITPPYHRSDGQNFDEIGLAEPLAEGGITVVDPGGVEVPDEISANTNPISNDIPVENGTGCRLPDEPTFPIMSYFSRSRTGRKMLERKLGKLVRTYFILTLGIQMTLMQCLCTAISSLLVTYIRSVSPMEITTIRLSLQFFISVPILIYYDDDFFPKKKYLYTITFRSVTSTIGITSLIYSLAYMPISDASAISRTSPLYVSVLGRIFLHEPITVTDSVLLLLVMVGVGLITKPEFIFGTDRTQLTSLYPHKSWGVGYALLSALTIAISMVSIKKANTPMAVNMFNFSIVGIPLLLSLGLPLKLFRLPACGIERFYLLLSAIFGALSQILLYTGLRNENAGVVASLNSSAIFYAMILQIIFLKEIPHWNSWLGGAIIMLTVTIYGLRKWSLNRPKGPVISKYVF